ncbi:MAG: TetR/AcrR family transcriptional regulator [Lachnospiraceae bacterium]
MVHIGKDKRTKRSAERIWSALLSCLETSPFADITVADLARAGHFARTTFYRCFDNTVDVVEWKCDAGFYEALDSYRPAVFGGERDLARHFFTYWMDEDHVQILELLIRIGREDIIFRYHEKNAELLHRRYGDLQRLASAHPGYFMAVRTGFTISILSAWIRGGKRESTEELLAIMEEQVTLLQKNWRGTNALW